MGRPAGGPESLLRGYSGRVFLLVTVTFVAIKTGQRILPPLLPLIVEDLELSAATAGLALSLMGFARALLQYPSGRYADRLSRKTVLLASLCLAVIGFVVIASVPLALAFFVGTVVIGAAVGLWDPADRALVSDLFREKRGRAFGFHLMGSDVAGMIAAGLAALVAVATWREAFWPAIVVMVPGLILLARWVREPVRIGWVPLGIQRTGLRLFADAHVRGSVLVFVLVVFASQGITGFLPIYLISRHGFSFEVASLTFGVIYATGILVRPTSGSLSDRVPRLGVVAGMVLVSAVGVVLLIVGPTPAAVVGGVVGYAIGYRGYGPPLQAYLMDRFPDDSMAGDIGAVRATYTVVGSAGPAFVGVTAEAASMTVAFAALAVLYVGAGVVAAWMLRTG